MRDDIELYLSPVDEPDTLDYARQLAEQWGLGIRTQQPDSLALVMQDGLLQLKDFAEPKLSGVVVDFLSGSSRYRQQHGGGRREPIAKAVGIKGESLPRILDATPGLGRDAFVLVGLGCEVVMAERSPVVAALLQDGLNRLAKEAPELAARFSLLGGDSKRIMQHWHEDDSHKPVDVVYLDPMFPHRKKSALVKKEMRLFQQLLGHDEDADELLGPALAVANKRVVVKRPNNATVLAGRSPSMAIESKKHRFDVYLSGAQHD